MNRDSHGQAIWQEYVEGQEEAFSKLYSHYVDRLFIYGCAITPDQTFVKDAIQDIFLRLLQREKSVLRIENISSYLFVALRNYLNKKLNQKSRNRQHELNYSENLQLTEEISISLSDEISRPLGNAIREHIDKLPPRQREILYLRFYEGFDYEEIASIMSVNYQVTRNYAYRGIARLRKQMEGIHQFLPYTLLLIISLLL